MLKRSLPLRTGFFPTPELTCEEEEELSTFGRSLVPVLKSPEAEWSFLADKNGVHLSEDRQKGGVIYSIRASTTVQASLDDVMDMFLATTTNEFRLLMRMQLRDLFLDGAVLYQSDQSDTESLSIKWFALKNKSPLAPNQDFCVLEYAGIIPGNLVGEASETQVGICLYESIDQDECPSLWESHKLERSSISNCGYLFYPRQEGVIEAQFFCSIRQPQGVRTKRRANRVILQSWAESLGNIQESINTKRISRLLAKSKANSNWVSDSDRQCCRICLKTFSNMRRKHHCRACGEVICSKCSTFNAVNLPSIGLTSLRLCRSCMDGDEKGNESNHFMETLGAFAEKDPNAATATAGTTTGTTHQDGSPDASQEAESSAQDEYALALSSHQLASVPDLVGLAWLRQLAARDPTKREMIEVLVSNLKRDASDASSAEEADKVDVYDTLCDLAAEALNCKFAVVSLVDEEKQYFRSMVPTILKSDIPRDFSFCEYPVQSKKPLVVMDTLKDSRLYNNPFVTGILSVRFLAGAPLFDLDGKCVGSVCVLDTEPREYIPDSQIAIMEKLAHLAMASMHQKRREQKRQLGSPSTASNLLMASETGQSSGATQSDLVPLDSFDSSTLIPLTQKSDPVDSMQQQMMDLLKQSNAIRKQVEVNTKSWGAQEAGLESSGE